MRNNVAIRLLENWKDWISTWKGTTLRGCNKTLGELKVSSSSKNSSASSCCNKTLGELKPGAGQHKALCEGRCNKTLGELKRVSALERWRTAGRCNKTLGELKRVYWKSTTSVWMYVAIRLLENWNFIFVAKKVRARNWWVAIRLLENWNCSFYRGFARNCRRLQ